MSARRLTTILALIAMLASCKGKTLAHSSDEASPEESVWNDPIVKAVDNAHDTLLLVNTE